MCIGLTNRFWVWLTILGTILKKKLTFLGEFFVSGPWSGYLNASSVQMKVLKQVDRILFELS